MAGQVSSGASGIGISMQIDPASLAIMAQQIEKAINGDIQKMIEERPKKAAEFFKEKIEEAYKSPSGKAALSEVTVEWRAKYGFGGSIPLFHTGSLWAAITAKQDERSKNSSTWVVTFKPGAKPSPGIFGGTPKSLAEIAEVHEGGGGTVLPRNLVHKSIPARPVWGPTLEKNKGKLFDILEGKGGV